MMLERPAVITDLDGTLSIAENRRYNEFDKVATDTPDYILLEILQSLISDNKRALIVITSRPDLGNCRADSMSWIESVIGRKPDLLLMRKEGDHSPDYSVKRRLFERYIVGRYAVDIVFEDKPSVVSMWREKGLRCYEVANNERG